jgi:hypothetical protein
LKTVTMRFVSGESNTAETQPSRGKRANPFQRKVC